MINYIFSTVFLYSLMLRSDSISHDARYLCVEDASYADVMNVDFRLTPGDAVVTAVYAYDAVSKTTPYSDCAANFNSDSSQYQFKFSLNMTGQTQLTPTDSCGFSFQSDTMTLVMRTFQNPALDTASDRFYVITCEKSQLTSMWTESSAFGVGDVDTVPLNHTRSVTFLMLNAGTGELQSTYRVGESVYLEFQLEFKSAIEGIDFIGASLVNVMVSSSSTFTTSFRYLADSNGCPVDHPEDALQITSGFIVNTTALVSPFVARTSIFEVARFADGPRLNIRADIQYCTRSTDRCFETVEEQSARCNGSSTRRKRSVTLVREGYPSSVSTTVEILSVTDKNSSNFTSSVSGAQTLETCTSSLQFYMIAVIAVFGLIINIAIICYLVVRLRRVRLLRKVMESGQPKL